MTQAADKSGVMDTEQDEEQVQDYVFEFVADQQEEEFVRASLYTPTDSTELSEHLGRVAEDLSRWNRLLATAVRAHGHAEAELRAVESERFAYYKDKLTRIKGKATESDVKACVRSDKGYQEAHRHRTDCEANVQDLRGHCDSVRTKLEALKVLGYMAARELGQPAVR